MSDEITSDLWSVIQTLQAIEGAEQLSPRQQRKVQSIVSEVDALRVEIKRSEHVEEGEP